MTSKKFYSFTLVQWLVIAVLKVWFFNNQVLANTGIQQIIFWILAAAVCVALVRRFGVINYLEAFYTVIFWTIFDLIFDLIFVTLYTGMAIFYRTDYWYGFLAMAIAIVVFHKKRHVAIRHGGYHEVHPPH